jgi:hypothetical protein
MKVHVLLLFAALHCVSSETWAQLPGGVVQVAGSPIVATRFEETDLSTAFTKGWVHHDTGKAWSGKTASFTWNAGTEATFTFTGTTVRWIGYRGPQGGIAVVSLDGVPVRTVDTYAPVEELQAEVFSATGLDHRAHTLNIKVSSLSNPASSGVFVVVDAFDVEPPQPLPPTGARFEETDPALTYSGDWTQGDASTAWSGGTAARSTTAGVLLNISFTGNSVSWIGYRGPEGGMARAFIDGTLVGLVDTYSKARVQAVVFSATGLAFGNHTLTIEVTGQRNAAATDSRIVADAFDVRTRYEETHPSITYTGTWEATVSRAWSERTAVFTWETGARATFAFTGTSVRWIGWRGPEGGLARVYLDGVFVTQVDTYAFYEKAQAVIFSATGLPSANHTLTIVVLGTQNLPSTKPFIAVDAFDVNF